MAHASLHLRNNHHYDVIGTVIFISVSAIQQNTPVVTITNISIRLLDESPEEEEAERSCHHCCNKEIVASIKILNETINCKYFL
jgi:hypothetical protein